MAVIPSVHDMPSAWAARLPLLFYAFAMEAGLHGGSSVLAFLTDRTHIPLTHVFSSILIMLITILNLVLVFRWRVRQPCRR